MIYDRNICVSFGHAVTAKVDVDKKVEARRKARVETYYDFLRNRHRNEGLEWDNHAFRH
jgi:hypothetical protein